MTNGDHEGQTFLSAPHTNSGLLFLFNFQHAFCFIKSSQKFLNTVKPVLRGHSKIDKTKVLKENAFDLHYAIIGLENQYFVFCLSGH